MRTVWSVLNPNKQPSVHNRNYTKTSSFPKFQNSKNIMRNKHSLENFGILENPRFFLNFEEFKKNPRFFRNFGGKT